MNIQDILNRLPDASGAVVTLSGGMDSTIAMRFAIQKYGVNNVAAISFFYGQKQSYELIKAQDSTTYLGVKHKLLNLSVLGEIGQGFSANLDTNVEMPEIQDVLGDPQPVTYVPYRNLILLSIASSFAEVNKLPIIICGLQVHDEYSYWDTTQEFVDKVNGIVQLNREFKPKIIAPFSDLSKTDEIKLLMELDNNIDLLNHTLTCYNPLNSSSCGKCPSCSERMKAFSNLNLKDPAKYSCVQS